MMRIWLLIGWLLWAGAVRGEAESFVFTTLNCYWFFQEPGKMAEEGAPRGEREYDQKAGHLVGLLPAEAPLFVGLQEIGDTRDVERLAHAASRRYKRRYEPLFVQGRDTATQQDVAALLDTSRGWGVYGRASRVSELEKELSKHLVVRLTNATAHIDVAVVHLLVPRSGKANEKQRNQNRAMLRWSMRHLAKDPEANVIIMGDFNEGKPVGSNEQNLAVLFQARPPMIDVFDHFKGKPVTHAGGKALDRILISEGLFRGASGLRFGGVTIQRHSHGKGDWEKSKVRSQNSKVQGGRTDGLTAKARRLYTDHFPVSVVVRE